MIMQLSISVEHLMHSYKVGNIDNAFLNMLNNDLAPNFKSQFC